MSPDKHVVCLGLSFIGLESASYLAKKVAKVTIVGRDTIPLRHSFGPEVGVQFYIISFIFNKLIINILNLFPILIETILGWRESQANV